MRSGLGVELSVKVGVFSGWVGVYEMVQVLRSSLDFVTLDTYIVFLNEFSHSY